MTRQTIDFLNMIEMHRTSGNTNLRMYHPSLESNDSSLEVNEPERTLLKMIYGWVMEYWEEARRTTGSNLGPTSKPEFIELLTFLCVKTLGLEGCDQVIIENQVNSSIPVVPSSDSYGTFWNGYEIAKNLMQRFYSYVYFGYDPLFLPVATRDERDLSFEYFMWIRTTDDPVALRDRGGIEISDSNFHNGIWSVKKLSSYYFKNILPLVLERYGLKMNPSLKTYKDIFQNEDYSYFYMIVKSFINKGIESIIDMKYKVLFNTALPKDTTNIKLIPEYKDLIKDLENWRSFPKNDRVKVILLSNLIRAYNKQLNIKNTLDNKLKNIATSRERFQWQNLCKASKLNELDMELLEELATQERIPHYLMMTKRELCSEFAKRFENVITGKRKVEPMCANISSILGTDIKDIPPEFFYSYTHNNKIFCDDIRDLYKHFQINGNKSPFDRSIVKQSLVNNVSTQINYLKYSTANNMEDLLGFDPVISLKSQLSNKFTDLSSKLNYPNSSLLFINANEEQIKEFVTRLLVENILTINDVRQLSGFTDVERQKLILIDMLLLKIQNDPQQIQIPGSNDPLSEIAINLSNVYNDVFK